jgi:hypothetical protein
MIRSFVTPTGVSPAQENRAAELAGVIQDVISNA